MPRTIPPHRDLKEIRCQLLAVKAEMKAKGIRRTSCFNGGHSPESYRLNSECFRLETLAQRIQPSLSSAAVASRAIHAALDAPLADEEGQSPA